MNRKQTSEWSRPRSLAEVVVPGATTEDIGYHLADFLDHVNLLVKQRATRRKLAEALRREPRRTGDAVQDAYLAAVAAHLAGALRLPAPRVDAQADAPPDAAMVRAARCVGARLAAA